MLPQFAWSPNIFVAKNHGRWRTIAAMPDAPDAPDPDTAPPGPGPYFAAVRELGAAMDRFEEAAARALGIARSDLRALNLLEHGPVGAREIAQHLRLTSGSVTGVVDRLVDAGYVSREADPDDRRRILVRLEPAVHAAFARVYAPCGQAVQGIATALDADVAAAAADALRRTAAAIDAEEARLRAP